MTLKEAGEAAGGMDYTAVAVALKRFEKKSEKEERIAALIREAKNECEK